MCAGALPWRSAPMATQIAAAGAVPGGGVVASIAHGFGVPTETLCTVLLLCAVLFAWRSGMAILRTVGVLLISAVLTLYAFARRVRRQQPALLWLGFAALAAAFTCAMLPHSAKVGAIDSLLPSRLLRPPVNVFVSSVSN